MVSSLFIAHGAPLLAIEDNEYTRFLSDLGQTMKRPKAVILFSAHWESDIQMVSRVDKYKTLYDFGGFPEELYRIQYPAKGHSKLAEKIESLLSHHGISSRSEQERGLDHGAWVVLRLLYPDADIPVIAMSVDPNLAPDEQYKIGQALSELRAEDVLIIGSGGTVHNLMAVNMAQDRGSVDDRALSFDEWLSVHLESWDLDQLFQYESEAPHVQFAVPSYGKEHFVPLFYAMGAAADAQKATLLHRSYRYGNLSHSVWQFG